MIQETVRFYTDKEEECINALIAIGFARRVAVLLVFLARTKETPFREIEHGTDLQYSSISKGMKYLVDRGWVRVGETGSPNGGRNINMYSLALPVPKILATVEQEKKEEMNRQIAVLTRLKKNSR